MEKERIVPRTLITKCAITLDYYFTGRTTELVLLQRALNSGKTAGVKQAVAGLGGIGKSSLARAYANANYGDYDAIFYLNASNVGSLVSSYRAIDLQFEPPLPSDATDEEVRQIVQSYLNTYERYLLIVDNADFEPNYQAKELQPYLPEHVAGQILLTTRSTPALDALNILSDHIITLHDMQERDAATLLWERVKGKGVPIPSSEWETLLAIARALYNFPLALEQASAYITEQRITHREYLSDQKHGVVALLKEQQANIGQWSRNEQYRRAVSTTWMQNVQALMESGKAASVNLLTVSAFLAPEAIPIKEIADALAQSSDDFAAAVFNSRRPEDRRSGDYSNLLKPLLDYSLVSKDADRGTFDIHRLLQEVILYGMPEEERQKKTADVVALLNVAYPDEPDFEHRVTCERLTMHNIAALEHIRLQNLHTVATADLLHQTAFFLGDCKSRYADALPLYREAIAIYLKELNPDDLTIAFALNNLATAYQGMALYRKALPLFKKSLAIRRKSPSPVPATIARALNNLGGVYNDEGNYAKALCNYWESLAIWRGVLTPKPAEVARILGNLGTVYKNMGIYTAALTLCEEALEINRSLRPVTRPDIANDLNNIAVVHYYMLDGSKPAKPVQDTLALHIEAVAIMQSGWGETHPDTQLFTFNALRFVRRVAAGENGLSMEKVNALPEFEQRALFDGPTASFWASVNKHMEQLQQAQQA